MFDHTLSCRPERAEPPKNGCCYSFARSGIKTFSYSTRVSPLITVKSHCLFLFLARLFPPCLLFLPIMRWSIPWQNIESFQYTHQVTNQPTPGSFGSVSEFLSSTILRDLVDRPTDWAGGEKRNECVISNVFACESLWWEWADIFYMCTLGSGGKEAETNTLLYFATHPWRNYAFFTQDKVKRFFFQLRHDDDGLPEWLHR